MIRSAHDYLKYSLWCKAEFDELLEEKIKRSDVLIVGLTFCPWTVRAKTLFTTNYSIDPSVIAGDVVSNEYKVNLLYCLSKRTGTTNVPQIFIKGKHVGSFEQLWKMHHRKQIIL